MPDNYKAFVCSTYTDLKSHRKHICRALEEVGISFDSSENWASEADSPQEFSENRLDGCDLCVLLLGFDRGAVPDGQLLSITQLEYRAALERRMDVLVFLREDNAPWSQVFDETESDESIARWRYELTKNHPIHWFRQDPYTLDAVSVLARWLRGRPKERAAFIPMPPLRLGGEDTRCA